jgi:hypothetical protein
MKNKLKSKINWLNIIISTDFFEYLDLELLKEVSMASRLVREKINLHLFGNLELSTRVFEINFKNNIFTEYINRCVYPESYTITSIDDDQYLNELNIENGLNDFIYSLKDIKRFAKSFNFEEAQRAEYYLFPIINVFDNLVSLRLNFIAAPLDAFNKIGTSLKSLKGLEVIDVTLCKPHFDNASSDQVNFPPNLSFLDISFLTIATFDGLSNPHEFLLNQCSQKSRNNFHLPSISIPNLKKLSYFNDENINSELYSFLEVNPNLEILSIKSFSENFIEQLKSIKCLEVYNVEYINTKEKVSVLNNIEKLWIKNVYTEYYENIKKLCSLCPKLENLNLTMRQGDSVQNSIDRFLVPLVTNLTLLKTLKLKFRSKQNENPCFTKVPNIESLIIDTQDYAILNLNFDTCTKLKKVKFISYLGDLNTQEFRDKFNSYKNWKFKFSLDTIKGYRINY